MYMISQSYRSKVDPGMNWRNGAQVFGVVQVCMCVSKLNRFLSSF